jgi:hypothetical protein
MISAHSATCILIGFIIFFGVILPIMNKKIPQFISYRWSVLVVILALSIGVIIDFEKLSEESRKIVLMGGMIISGGYIFFRTIEKILANGWIKGTRIEAKKGDIEVKIKQDEKKL